MKKISPLYYTLLTKKSFLVIRSYWYSKNSALYIVLNNLVLIKKFNSFHFIIKFYYRWNGNYNNYLLFKRRGILLIWMGKKPWIPFSRWEGCLIEIEQMAQRRSMCVFSLLWHYLPLENGPSIKLTGVSGSGQRKRDQDYIAV